MAYKQKRIDHTIQRAALYARVSTEEQAIHGVSLDAQKERLIQYAKENNLTIVDLYVDEGISARKRYTRRPAFMKMIADIQSNKIDVILFIKLDRWFRNIADFYEVQTILDRHKVQWIATEEDYDTTTANGRLALNIKLAIAQDEADRTSERIKFAFQNMVKEGRVISGMTSLGFDIKDKHVIVNEQEAEIVRAMFEKYIDCRSMKATARYLLEQYGKNIDVKSMKRMLTNTWYIGQAYGIENWCPSIVDKKTFGLANTIIETRSARYDGTRTDRVYLFTGLLCCKTCGRRLTTYACSNKKPDGSVKQTFIYYRCPAHAMKLCEMSKQINQSKLEEWLLENIQIEADQYNRMIQDQKKAAPKKNVDIAKITAKLEKLKDLYLNDLITKEMYQKDYVTLITNLNEAKQQQADVSQKPINTKKFKDLKKNYSKLSEESKKAFWSRTIKQINVTQEGTFEIEFNTNQ